MKTPEQRAAHAAREAARYHSMSVEDRARRTAGVRARTTAHRAEVAALKARPCADCGGTFPPECMDLDHLPGTNKYLPVSKMLGRSMAMVLEEAAKCEVVCSNCHRTRTKRRRHEV